QDEVYVFTPKGDVKALAKGSTPIDFAYDVHTDIGNHCSGARVNGLIVPLRYQMRNGDTVEIITSAAQKPSKDWLKFVATSRAKAKIRYYIRTEQRLRAKELGRELLERELRRYGVSIGRAEKQGDLDRAAKHFKVNGVDELVTFIGFGRVTPADVVEVI